MLTLGFLTPYPSLLHSSLPFLFISLSPTSCALASLFVISWPLLFCSLVRIQYAYDIRAAKCFRCSSTSIIILNAKLKNKKQGRPGNEATTPFTPPTFIHPMPSLSTSPPALLDNEVTAVSTIWRAQPDNKTVSDRR